MICGGTEATITPMGVGGFASMKALSTRNDDPAHASRPFDAQRDGFVVGEGAGVAGARAEAQRGNSCRDRRVRDEWRRISHHAACGKWRRRFPRDASCAE